MKKSKERERKALEEERKRLEEERRLKEEEQQRLKEQAGADVHEVQTRSTNLLFLGEGIKSEVEWQQFLECNPLPNVYKESELTTYRSMWEQDIEADCDQVSLN